MLRFTVPPIFSGEEIERAIRILAAGKRPKHSERGKAWPKDSQPKRKTPQILNRNTRRLLEQVEDLYPPKPRKPKNK